MNSSRNPCLATLPTEIMMNILEFVPLKDLLNISLVSKMFYTLATEPLLWKGFKLPNNIQPEILISILKMGRLRKLEILRLVDNGRKTDLSQAQITPEQILRIFRTLKKFNLKTLVMEHFDLRSLDPQLISSILSNIYFVSLKKDVLIDDEQVLEIVTDIAKHRKMKILQVKEVDFSFIKSHDVSKAINTLNIFDSFYCEFSQNQLEAIFNEMAIKTSLKQLSFFSGYYDEFCDITPGSLSKAFNNLESLYIGYCCFSSEQLVSFFQQLSEKSKLLKINFFFQDSSPPLLSSVSPKDLSKGLNNLEEAVMPYLALSESQMKMILEGVAKDDSKLKSLNLGDNVVPDLSLEVLKKLMLKLQPNEYKTKIRQKLIEVYEKAISKLKAKVVEKAIDAVRLEKLEDKNLHPVSKELDLKKV